MTESRENPAKRSKTCRSQGVVHMAFLAAVVRFSRQMCQRKYNGVQRLGSQARMPCYRKDHASMTVYRPGFLSVFS